MVYLQFTQGIGVSGEIKQIVLAVHREMVIRKLLYGADIWIDYLEELGGGGELENMSRVTNPGFQYEKATSLHY